MEFSRTSIVPPAHDAVRARNGRLAGALFLLSAAASVPSTLLLDPQPPIESYLLTVAVVIIGVVILLAPWVRLGDAWIHLVTATGTVAVTASLIVFSVNYRAIYFVVLAYAAYVFETRRAIAAHTVLACAGLTLGLGVADTGSMAIADILTFVPALVLVTALIAYLNEQLAESRDAYREFAGETIDLALRIRTSAGGVRRDTEFGDLERAADELQLRSDEPAAGPARRHSSATP